MLERGLLIFNFFCYFFHNLLARVEYERNSGIKYFSPFLDLSHPVFTKNNTRKRFFYFLNFLAIFFGIFLPWSSMNRIWDYNFLLSFPGYLILFCLKRMLERGFWIIFLFFSEFSFPYRVLTEFGTKIFFFSLSRPISSCFGSK